MTHERNNSVKLSVLFCCVFMLSALVVSGCRSNSTISSTVSDIDAQQAAQKLTDLFISHCGHDDSRWGFFPVGAKLSAYTLKVDGKPIENGDTESRFLGYEWIGSVAINTKNQSVDGREFNFERKSGIWYYIHTDSTVYEGKNATEVTSEVPFNKLNDIRPGCGS